MLCCDPAQADQLRHSPPSTSRAAEKTRLLADLADCLLVEDDFVPVLDVSASMTGKARHDDSAPFDFCRRIFPQVSVVKSHLSSDPGQLWILKTTYRVAAHHMNQARRHEEFRLQGVSKAVLQTLFPTVELDILKRARLASPPVPIIGLLAAFTSPTGLHLALERASGDLASLVGVSEGARDPKNVVRWAAEAVAGLAWLHDPLRGFVHRDVKPSNLLLRADGHLLLTDFGSAAPLQSWQCRDGRVRRLIPEEYQRSLIGTVDYIAFVTRIRSDTTRTELLLLSVTQPGGSTMLRSSCRTPREFGLGTRIRRRPAR